MEYRNKIILNIQGKTGAHYYIEDGKKITLKRTAKFLTRFYCDYVLCDKFGNIACYNGYDGSVIPFRGKYHNYGSCSNIAEFVKECRTEGKITVSRSVVHSEF